MARRNVEADCKLCCQRGLICRSHIIPEYAYRRAYDETGTASSFSSPHFRERRVQKGLWEHMLCQSCEAHIERIETEFRRFWGVSSRFPSPLNQPYISIDGFDYEVTAKFLLSIVWRAHVAKHRTLVAIDLGPHAEPIRDILHPTSTKAVGDRYPTYGYALRDPLARGLADFLVLSPRRARLEGRWNYELALLGCLWMIFISSPPPTVPTSCKLNKAGTIVLPVVNCTDVPSVARALGIDATGGA